MAYVLILFDVVPGPGKAMRRREFIKVIAASAGVWPIAAWPQQKLPTIGLLGPASASAMSTWTAAFVQRLRELGWIEYRDQRRPAHAIAGTLKA